MRMVARDQCDSVHIYMLTLRHHSCAIDTVIGLGPKLTYTRLQNKYHTFCFDAKRVESRSNNAIIDVKSLPQVIKSSQTHIFSRTG